MKRFYKAVVKNHKIIIVVFIFLSVLGILLYPKVKINYDMADYLPQSSPSTLALSLMAEEFDGGIPNARVMVRDVSVPEALEYKKKISECAGVASVMWLDDAENVFKPLETIDEHLLNTYYKNGDALFTIIIEDGMQEEAINAVRAVIGSENAMTGNAVVTAVAITGTIIEVALVTIIAVLFVYLVLIITTTSWMEPLLVMAGLAVAAIINAGSNIIFGEISFVTNAASAILQIAVSLDYSVFLIHRFEECQKEISDPEEAMVEALSKSAGSILSSGLTTVIGFIALMFMQFGIGMDLGRALAKGVAISIITVFVFMPSIILSANKKIKSTRHKSFLPDFKGFGRLIYRAMLPMVCIFVIAVVPGFLAYNSNDFYYGYSNIYGPGTQLYRDTAAIEQRYGKSDTYAIMVPKGSVAMEQKLSYALNKIPEVTSVLSYVDTVGAEIPVEFLDSGLLSRLVSKNYSRFAVTVNAEHEGAATFELIERMRDTVNSFFPGAYFMTGNGVTSYDLMDTITSDNLKVNFIAIIAVFLVLLFTMKSVSLPVILVLAIENAIWINLAIPYFEGNTIFYISYLIISSVQLGATVDYAILFTDRYCESRSNLNKKQAVLNTVAVVTPSVLTSGSVMAVVGFLLGNMSSHGILAQLGVFVGRGALLSLFIVLFVLPGLLYFLDAFIQRTTAGLKFADAKLSK